MIPDAFGYSVVSWGLVQVKATGTGCSYYSLYLKWLLAEAIQRDEVLGQLNPEFLLRRVVSKTQVMVQRPRVHCQ